MKNIQFNSYKNHNPHCDIMQANLDKDTLITWGVHLDSGMEFSEVYAGKNYVIGSSKNNYSRYYLINDVPEKYKCHIKELKQIYKEQLG